MRFSRTASVSESQEQQALVKWFRLQYPQFISLFFHIPNGGLRNVKTAARLKSEGVMPGVADLFLAIPRCNCHGLFIEMKRSDGGRQSLAQREFETQVKKQGYDYALCHGWKDAANKITGYLKCDF